jgi:hypothetical protein
VASSEINDRLSYTLPSKVSRCHCAMR